MQTLFDSASNIFAYLSEMYTHICLFSTLYAKMLTFVHNISDIYEYIVSWDKQNILIS